MEKIRQVVNELMNSNLFATFIGGFFGALLYAIQKKMNFWQSLITVTFGGAGAVFLAPLIVTWAGLGHNPSIYAGIGFVTGMLVKEVAEIVIKILDELEKNPAFLVDLIRKRFGGK